jgi:hypothetical protein
MDVTPSTSKAQVQLTINNSLRPLSNVTEDDVDQQLWKQNGKIERKRDEKL